SNSSTTATTISGNTVGGPVAHSLYNPSSSIYSVARGIGLGNWYSGYYKPSVVIGNTVRNITVENGTQSGTLESLSGIWYYGTTTPAHTVRDNAISHLSHLGTGTHYASGIRFYGGNGSVVEQNTIDSLSVTGTGHITGLYYQTGTGTGNTLRGNTVQAL